MKKAKGRHGRRLNDVKSSASRITREEGLELFKNADLLGLGMMADRARKKLHTDGDVTFIIDRNINYTNVCINRCAFCAFYRDKEAPDAYVLSSRQLFRKIRETVACGGTQILMQGGLHPELDIDYYIDLLKAIKQKFDIHVHGFSPPEIYYMADKAGFTLRKTIKLLQEAGLDSIPGGGAEILSDRIREKVSPKKIRAGQWLKVMEEAHKLGMKTTATMMFGSLERPDDIIEHLDAIRRLQDRTGGFTAFIPWSFRPASGSQKPESRIQNSQLHPATGVEYLRILALSRIYLDNFPNLQASWVTQGLKIAQVALRFGANDFGSTMLEENVVASTGIKYNVSIKDIISAIKASGFKPAQRDMYYNRIKYFR
jgi:cyclic dehypoxanthinyl futalosine synthase